MFNRELKATLINLSMEAEMENYNGFWVRGLVHYLNLLDPKNLKQKCKIMNFLKKTNLLTQRLYLEICYVCR